MNKFAIVAAVSLFLAPVSASSWELDAMNRQIDQTNVLMNDNCSGTLLDAKKGYVLTAAHCVEDQYRVVNRTKINDDGTVKEEKVRIAVPGTFSYLKFKDTNEVSRSTYTYKIILSDDRMDLALVKTEGTLPDVPAAPIACKMPERGEKVFAVGNPYAVLYSSVSTGIVSGMARSWETLGFRAGAHEGGELIQSTAPIAGGNSGGALYNGNGELIGVNNLGATSVTFSVSLNNVKKFLMREGLNTLWSRCDD